MSSEEEDDNVQDIEALQERLMNTPLSERMLVSGWENDDDGIDETRYPSDKAHKEILTAAENGDLNIIRMSLIKDPSLINAEDLDGYYPLHKACSKNHLEIVEFLLDQGAKTNVLTADEWEPLHCASYWNNVECMRTLLGANANINAQSKGVQTPLHLVSATSHNSPALQLLLLHPAIQPVVENNSGDTAEQIARRTGKYYPLFEMIEECFNYI